MMLDADLIVDCLEDYLKLKHGLLPPGRHDEILDLITAIRKELANQPPAPSGAIQQLIADAKAIEDYLTGAEEARSKGQ